MFHNGTRVLDGTGDCDLWSRLQEGVRLIDHHSLLMAKLMQYDINPYIINWIAAFLSNEPS